MRAEISPVKAPSGSQYTSCAAIRISVPCAPSTAVVIAVKGGAMMMSQCLEPADKGLKASKKARVSARVLYIFQLPAITGRRNQNSLSFSFSRLAWGVRESLDARELFACEKFQ